jgi:hypothetical protein
MTTKMILAELEKGTQFGNHNTDFLIKGSELLMCEYTRDCKYTHFTDLKKFARRILKFYKTGY